MNDSHFLVTEADKHLVVISSFAPDVVVRPIVTSSYYLKCNRITSFPQDQDFLDAMNPAAGQFSDSVKLVQTLLNPDLPNSPLTQYSMNKWLHSSHAFEEDDWTEIGFIWEIIKAQDSNGRLGKIILEVLVPDIPFESYYSHRSSKQCTNESFVLHRKCRTAIFAFSFCRRSYAPK
jgi:hypothetical protein